MKEIPLTKDFVTLVDDDVYEWLNQWKWRALPGGKTFYAVRNGLRPQRESIYLHREIMCAPRGMQVDHINGDGLFILIVYQSNINLR